MREDYADDPQLLEYASRVLSDYELHAPEDFVSCDPVQWWAKRQSQFYDVYPLARDILAIPGSAVEPERIFPLGATQFRFVEQVLIPLGLGCWLNRGVVSALHRSVLMAFVLFS
ncbi:hypothetical protein HGRIS_001213 [Hohenbuehelia grisea]|uniref:HAT C-terminal dimerisation domain-containing protein n=1 Tax=Hohenbuehelia grisea TaxID=104357 RepID=A0ABR3JP72_9AGAR